MQVKINKDKCIGCGLCTNLCSPVFEFGSDNKAEVKKGANIEKHKEDIAQAMNSCPVSAIEQE